jgi:peptidoglycan/LPS O-acetylase OafA/YrhL
MAHHFNFQASIPDMLGHSLFNTFFEWGHVRYASPLWTMSFEFIGSLLIFLSLLLVVKSRFRRLGIVAITFAMLIFTRKIELIGFMFGLLLCDGEVTGWLQHFKTKTALWIIIPLGLYLGSANLDINFADLAQSHFSWVLALKSFNAIPYPIIFLCLSLGATLLFTAVLGSPLLQRFFNWKPIAWLGKVSFGLYLSHYMVEFTLMPIIFMCLTQALHLPYIPAMITAMALTLPVQLWVAWLTYHVADRAGMLVANSSAKKIFIPLLKRLPAFLAKPLGLVA